VHKEDQMQLRKSFYAPYSLSHYFL